jgi:hypothetical protein
MPLRFTRYSNTRMAPQSSGQGRFGREGVWTHSYQWHLRSVGTYSHGQPALKLGYPDGADTLFVRSADDPTLWLGAANVGDRICWRIPSGVVSTAAAAQFVGLNELSSANNVVKQVKSSDNRSVVYDYSVFIDPSGWFRWGVLDKVTYPDTTEATYTYVQTADLTRPILSHAIDPRTRATAPTSPISSMGTPRWDSSARRRAELPMK